MHSKARAVFSAVTPFCHLGFGTGHLIKTHIFCCCQFYIVRWEIVGGLGGGGGGETNFKCTARRGLYSVLSHSSNLALVLVS